MNTMNETMNTMNETVNTMNETTNANTETINGIVESVSDLCINDYTMITKEYCGEWVGATIERLPLWGGKIPSDDFWYENFEWPQ